MPRTIEGHHLVPAGVELRHFHRGLVGLRTSSQQENPAQRLGQCRRKSGRQVEHWTAEHPAEQVVKRRHRTSYGSHNIGMPMAKNGTHLPGCEIQNRRAVLVIDVRPLRPPNNARGEPRTVTDQMATNLRPQHVFTHQNAFPGGGNRQNPTANPSHPTKPACGNPLDDGAKRGGPASSADVSLRSPSSYKAGPAT